MKQSEIILYKTEDGSVKIDTVFQSETIWLTQSDMADLFDVKIPAISKHLKNIFESEELDEKVVVSILERVASFCNSPSSKMFFKCLDIAGTFTPKSSAMEFWLSQMVSFWKMVSILTAPSSVL